MATGKTCMILCSMIHAARRGAVRGVRLRDVKHVFAKCACGAAALRKVRLCRAAFTLLRRAQRDHSKAVARDGATI